jgi:spermidine/putrescine transport system permease protein
MAATTARALGTTGDGGPLRRARFAPYLMSLPGLLCLYLFFVVPLVTLLKIALSVRIESGSSRVDFRWEWGNFSRAFTDFGEHLGRAFAYAAIATVLCVVLAYPMAYFIAFKCGRWRNLMLGLVMVPFFTSFLLRTIAWQSLFADDGPILGVLDALRLTGLTDAVGLTTDGRIMYTAPAVVGGLTYNFLPFALLPIYVSLEKIDPALVNASSDLYAGFGRTFRRVILPLSMPGVFAGTLLVFIPAAGDFINNELLGNAAREPVIGGVIQARFLNAGDLPTASAISFVLMALITVIVLLYARFLGTEELV